MFFLKVVPSRYTLLRQWLLVRDKIRKFPWRPLLEIGMVVLWALWLGRRYLDFSMLEWPHGREFGMAIQPHYIWTLLRECGDCLLWNGMYNGGSPAFAELHAAVLHPLVIIATLIWGGLNGAKVVLIASLAMAGLGQLWLGYVLKLGPVPRLWGAFLVTAGGHLAGRMEIGVVGVVLSTAACSLAIAPALKLALYGRRRDAIIFGFILALAIVSGQGYLQLGFALSVLPIIIIFWVDKRFQLRPVWKEFFLAGLLALLLASPLLVPLAHFGSEFGKDVDPFFESVQPLKYIPLNYVIDDLGFYYSEELFKIPIPYLYLNFIGWAPILLGIIPLMRARPARRKQMLFLILALFMVLVVSAALPFKWMARFWPTFAYGVRYPSLIQGLGVPFIVALGAWGADIILQQGWPLVRLAVSRKSLHRRVLVALTWVFMLIAMYRSLEAAYTFSYGWLFTSHNQDPVIDWVLSDVQTFDAQWVALPFGEHAWGIYAAENNLKLTDHVRPSSWIGRSLPPPFQKAARVDMNSTAPGFVSQRVDISIVRLPENRYASIRTADEMIPCEAEARGGRIEVVCHSSEPGQLIVTENQWDGWTAVRDDQPVLFLASQWLAVEAPAGTHVYQFRYRPLDVPLGVALFLLGVCLAALLWVRAHETEQLLPSP